MTAPASKPSSRPSAFDRVLLEAGSVVLNLQSRLFRNAAAREAGVLFFPGPPDVSAGKTGAARALREGILAMASATNDESRQHLAAAITSLAAAVRLEPADLLPERRGAATEPRRFWMERDQ